jgi:hypothetical protein
MKTMNSKTKATAEKIEWTSEALNVALPLYMDMQNLQVRSKESRNKFVNGTLHDADLMYQHIRRNLTLLPTNPQQWKPNFWYKTPPKQRTLNNTPISNTLEKAWKEVVDVYLRHQSIWDNIEEAQEIDDSESDEEMEFEEIDFLDI